jgi:DNA-binding transcriptional MerR regulator
MEIIAFTADHVRKLTGLSARQIRYWDDTGFFSPTLIDRESRRAFNRIYSFRDVVGLRAIALLRRKLPLQELRRVGEWLRLKHETPWSSLRLALAGRRVAFSDEGAGEFVEARDPSQQVFSVALEPIANEMREAAAKLRDRQESDFGRIIRNRYVVHNAWVLAGTRIPTQAIRNLHDAGYSIEAIIHEYPRLTPSDIWAALAQEVKKQAA